MKLTVLGSGTMVATKKRHPAAYLVDVDREKILLDCGHTTVARLLSLGVDILKLNFICITHLHTDHIADLMPIVHAQFVWGTRASQNQRKTPLYILGPVGIGRAYKKLREVMWPEPEENLPIQIEACTRNIFRFKNFKIETLAVKHTDFFNSVAYKISSGTKSIVYSGDLHPNQPFRNLIDFAYRTDAMILDAGRPIGREGNHLTPAECGNIGRRAQVKQLILTHLTDIDNPDEIKADLEKTYRENYLIAEDLLTINL